MQDRTPRLVLIGASVGLVLALAVFGSGSDPSGDLTSSTFADIPIPDPTLPATTLARAEEVGSDPIGHSSRHPITIPGLEGRLVVVIGQEPGQHTLVVFDIDAGGRVDAHLPEPASGFAIDASGSLLAFAAGTDHAEETWVLSITDPLGITAIPGATSFVWSGDEPRTAAWLDTEMIVLGGFGDSGAPNTSVLGAAEQPGERLAGLTSAGWWVTSATPAAPRSSFVEFLPRDADATRWSFPGDIVVPPASGSRALLARLDIATWRWTFGIGDGGLDPLPWAPGDAAGELGFAALSPSGPYIAFIGFDEPGSSWVEVQSITGGPVERITLPIRALDVSWSPDGRFVLVPGNGDAQHHALLLLDTVTGDVHSIEFDASVRYAASVPATAG